jgi:Mn-containing catalase
LTLTDLASEQFRGPQGERAAAMQYFGQVIAESDPTRKELLLDK